MNLSVFPHEIYFLQNFSVSGNGNHLPWQEFPAGHQRPLYGIFDPSAAGDLHSYYRYASDLVVRDDRRELFRIISLVQFGTSDERDAVADKIIMKISVGICRAVCSDEQIRTFEIRCIHRRQLDLYGPLHQAALCLFRRLCGAAVVFSADSF